MSAVRRELPYSRIALIVDDDQTGRDIVQRILESAGYGVQMASSVTEAIAILETARIDLVLSVAGMPGTNVADFVQELRRSRPRLSVVLMSGHLSPNVLTANTECGRIPFLQKPFHPGQLLSALTTPPPRRSVN